jgi:hypothetical protein
MRKLSLRKIVASLFVGALLGAGVPLAGADSAASSDGLANEPFRAALRNFATSETIREPGGVFCGIPKAWKEVPRPKERFLELG